MKADAVARKIAEIFEETDSSELMEISVVVSDAMAIAEALKRLDFEVKSEQRANGHKLTVIRRTSRPRKTDKANEKRG